MKFRRTILSVSITGAIATLSACGGGGGGGVYNNPNPIVRPDVPFATPARAGTHAPLVGNTYNSVVTDIFTQDLNNDRIDEVVIGGRMTYTPGLQRDSNLQIYGWNNQSTFSNETTTWFRAGENRITGTEPSIKFGDFNGDGRMDMMVASSADNSQHLGNTYIYLNQGNNNLQRVTVNVPMSWSHDSVVKDFNGDGVADFMVTDYYGQVSLVLGSNTGNFQTYSTATGSWPSSSIAVGDFLGDGRQLIVKGDAVANTGTGGQDVAIYSWAINNGALELTRVGVLPPSRFTLSKYSGIVDGSRSHEIRTMSMDFNRDGRQDIIVISSPGPCACTVSEMQFLQNNGSGNFTDVTDTVLVGYNTNTVSSYQPVVMDFNGDGLQDIFLGSPSTNGNRVLIQTQEGKFVESFGATFEQFRSQVTTLQGGTVSYGSIGVVAGPNNDRYIVTTVHYNSTSGGVEEAVYLSRIGQTGTVTAQASISTLAQVWPYLSPATANEALSRTALTVLGVDGQVIDLSAAMNPIGGLWMAPNGRTGNKIPITGGIAFPGAIQNLKQHLGQVKAVDELSRDFTVDLSGMSSTVGNRLQPLNWVAGHTANSSWSSKFTFQDEVYQNGLSYANTASNNYSISVDSSIINPNSDVIWRATQTVTPNSPWIMLSGMWGEIRSSTSLELSATVRNNQFWSQTGSIVTGTQLQPGLVSRISPITSVYSVAGWTNQGVTVYGGVKPYIVSGSIQINLPTGVDKQGTMHYTSYKYRLQNAITGFVGLGYSVDSRGHRWNAGAIADSLGQTAITLTYQRKF